MSDTCTYHDAGQHCHASATHYCSVPWHTPWGWSVYEAQNESEASIRRGPSAEFCLSHASDVAQARHDAWLHAHREVD